MTARLLATAQDLYDRSEVGIPRLPLSCRSGIYAARHVYAAIGHEVARAGHDSITTRARTSRRQKTALMGLSMLRAGVSTVMPVSAKLHARAAPEVAFLVDAAAAVAATPPKSETLLRVLAQLEARDRGLA
jgi:15-cis-phytoene synthase